MDRKFVRVLFEYKTENHNVLTLCEVKPVDFLPRVLTLEQNDFVAIHVELTPENPDPVTLAQATYERFHTNRPQFVR